VAGDRRDRFAGLDLVVAPGAVMRPRPATERLVAAAVERVGGRPVRIADVGTGSGAIALALAAACPEAEIWATDTSEAAVRLARLNACRLGLQSRVRIRRGDLLEPLPTPFDLVVANLPYLPEAVAGERPELAGEPLDALFAPGDGLDPYRRLVDAASSGLTPRGWLLVQLHGRVVAATRSELGALRAALGPSPAPHALAA
jgi:release factor glutamine methyltransferase